MIPQLQTESQRFFTQTFCQFQHFCKSRLTRTERARQRRDYDVLATNIPINFQYRGIAYHTHERYMCGNRNQSGVFTHLVYFTRIMTEKTGKFYPVIAYFFHLLKRTRKVRFHILANRIQLQCYRKVFHYYTS